MTWPSGHWTQRQQKGDENLLPRNSSGVSWKSMARESRPVSSFTRSLMSLILSLRNSAALALLLSWTSIKSRAMVELMT